MNWDNLLWDNLIWLDCTLDSMAKEWQAERTVAASDKQLILSWNMRLINPDLDKWNESPITLSPNDNDPFDNLD